MFKGVKESIVKIPNFVKIIIAVLVTLGSTSAGVAALSDVGLRPVVNSEIQPIFRRVAGIELRDMKQDRVQAQRDLYNVQKDKENYLIKKQAIPEYILNRERSLKNSLKDLDRWIQQKEKEINKYE